jgi:formate dehydrogenase accessory protein FdhD
MSKTASVKTIKYTAKDFLEVTDTVAVEASLNIMIAGEEKYSCLCSPGDDINEFADIANIDQTAKQIKITLAKELQKKVETHRQDNKITSESLFALQADFFSRQKIFVDTGATHAAAIYDYNGSCLAFAEDVGRHNALDKCIGKILRDHIKDQAYLVMLSSRLSYEMVSKLKRLGVQIIAGASAPTSLAIDVATEQNITLIGFLREQRFNIYSACSRIR